MPNEAFCLPGSTAVQEALERQDEGLLPRGWIDGLTLSNNVDDSAADIDIAAGCCRSTVNKAYSYRGAYSRQRQHQRDLEFPDSLTKQLDVVWAPGNGGGRSAESLADDSWHAFAIGGKHLRDSVFFHNSVTESSVLAAMPGGFTAYRHIMSIVRLTSIKPFTQIADEIMWTTPTLDVNNATPGTTANTGTLTVPTGIIVLAHINAFHNSGTAGMYISALAQADLAPSISAAPLTQGWAGTQAIADSTWVATNTSGQIRYRGSANSQFNIATLGFVHPRGRNS